MSERLTRMLIEVMARTKKRTSCSPLQWDCAECGAGLAQVSAGFYTHNCEPDPPIALGDRFDVFPEEDDPEAIPLSHPQDQQSRLRVVEKSLALRMPPVSEEAKKSLDKLLALSIVRARSIMTDSDPYMPAGVVRKDGKLYRREYSNHSGERLLGPFNHDLLWHGAGSPYRDLYRRWHGHPWHPSCGRSEPGRTCPGCRVRYEADRPNP